MRLVKRLLKNKLFLTGFSMIAGCFLVSLFYFIFFNDQIPSTSLLFSENRKPLPPPYNGSVYPPFGTDEFGRDIAFVMLVGAKYTIGAALLITMLRVVPAVFIGLFLQFF
ncbi:hypothetical protein QWY14_02650 [Planococcus sp. N028]|uniref:Uncharacterized protein n=1 Tax=Planococcus shixiaomingii TaxID=3058393 RepID=A0ABT8MYY4_9BACL|nr:hypothetical protein [Planococcus sp. N028]MDN7240668.1 hypothetical protein [Planococcus sp. N028]